MNIFVSGGNGFLGKHLISALVNQVDNNITAPSSKSCDLTKYKDLSKFNKTKFDQIYHLAAWTQAGDFCLHHPGEQWLMNQQINTNMLRWWKEEQPQAKLIAIGTSCCYEPGTPHVEDRFLLGEPIESLYTYAMTKRMLLAGMRAIQKQFRLRYLMLVPSTLYGPDYHNDGRQMHFIFDLVRKIVEGKHLGKEVVLWGDGSQKRELIHVRDFVSAMTTLAAKVDNELINIGGGREFAIRYFAEQIAKHVGFDSAKIQYDTSKYVGATSKLLVIDKLKKELPDFKHVEISQGINEVIEWYLREHGFQSATAGLVH